MLEDWSIPTPSRGGGRDTQAIFWQSLWPANQGLPLGLAECQRILSIMIYFFLLRESSSTPPPPLTSQNYWKWQRAQLKSTVSQFSLQMYVDSELLIQAEVGGVLESPFCPSTFSFPCYLECGCLNVSTHIEIRRERPTGCTNHRCDMFQQVLNQSQNSPNSGFLVEQRE